MKKWNITRIEFESGVWKEIQDFVARHPQYKKMIEDRLNDLLDFPDLFWQSAHIVDENHGYFLTKNQKIELAGKIDRQKALALVTHFSFHH